MILTILRSPRVRAGVEAFFFFAILFACLMVFNPWSFPNANETGRKIIDAVFMFLLVLLLLAVRILATYLPSVPLRDAPESNWLGPNKLPARERMWYFIGSGLLLAYTLHALFRDDFYLPGKRGSGMHLTGVSSWLMAAASFCAVASMVSALVDHHDERNNEVKYKNFSAACEWLGWGLAISATVVGMVRGEVSVT